MTEPLIKLKPCPFCGSKAKLFDSGGFYYVMCRNEHCNTSGPDDLGNSGACEAWNTRPTEAKLSEACRAANNFILENANLLSATFDQYAKAAEINKILTVAIIEAEGDTE